MFPVPAGVRSRTLQAQVTLRPGDTTRTPTQSVTFPGVASATARWPAWLIWTASGALLAVLAGFGGGVWRATRRAGSPDGGCGAATEVHPNDDRQFLLKL